MFASKGSLARRLSRYVILFALAVGAVGIVLAPVAAYASTIVNVTGPTPADILAAKTYGYNVSPYSGGSCSYGTEVGTVQLGSIAYVGSFTIGAGAGVGQTFDAGAPFHPCLMPIDDGYQVMMTTFVGSGAQLAAFKGNSGGLQPYDASFEVTTLGLAQVASSWQASLCTAPGGTLTSVCGSSSSPAPVGAIDGIGGSVSTEPCPNVEAGTSTSFLCNVLTDQGTGSLSALPSGYFTECTSSNAETYSNSLGGWVPAGYTCFVFGYGSQATPLNLSCSVAANASNGMVNFNYSDGSKYGWTSAITASATGASPASGTGGDSGVFSTVIPVSTTPSQIEVVWSKGSTFEGSCEHDVNFFPTSSGGRSGGAGSGVPADAPPGSFNFSACAPSGFGWLDPVSLLKGGGCLLQGLFVPTSNDLSSLYALVQVSPFMSALIAAPSRVTAVASSWSPTFHFGTYYRDGVSQIDSGLVPGIHIGSMTLPTISAGGYISTVVDCIVGIVDLVLLISVFT